MKVILKFAAFGLLLSLASCGTDINLAAGKYSTVLDKWIAVVDSAVEETSSAKDATQAITAADKATAEANALLSEMNAIDDEYPVSGKDADMLRAMLREKYDKLADLSQTLGETVGGLLARYAGDPSATERLTKAFDPLMILIPQE
ncbi:MAG: hypothetical protein HPY53_03570 [Brevinematales bacterium]|nr:hypothetical protein [Brevinematales bacterium]